MKKLMIAAASAAMIGGAFADGQVYDMTLNVKTTEAKSGTVNVNDGCYTSQSYRKQTSLKIAGLFWGCDCSTIAETDTLSQDKGVFFWNATKKSAFYDQEAAEYIQPVFEWKLLNRIGQKAADCEGVWELTYGDAYLYGAGFGKVTGYEEATYVKSMSGNFAGTMNPGNQCKRCEEQAADAWPLCECGDQDDDLTAAYGSWTLKFNASSAKKFANTEGGDWSWYKFPGDVLTAIQALIAGSEPVEDPCEDVNKAYNDALAAYTTAETEYKVATEVDAGTYNSYEPWIAASNTLAQAEANATKATETFWTKFDTFEKGYGAEYTNVTTNEIAKNSIDFVALTNTFDYVTFDYSDDKVSGYAYEFYRMKRYASNWAVVAAQKYAEGYITRTALKEAEALAADAAKLFDLAWDKVLDGLTVTEKKDADAQLEAVETANTNEIKADDEAYDALKAQQEVEAEADKKYVGKTQEFYADYVAKKSALEVAKANKAAAGCN